MKTALKGILLLALTVYALPALAGDTIEGIGIALANSNGQFVVHQVFQGSPAERAGVQVNDLITAVDGVATNGKSLEEVVKMIRGPAGTQTTITLSDGALANGGGHLRDAQIIREKFTVENDCFIEGNVLLNFFSASPNAPTSSISGNIGSTPVSGTAIGTSLNLTINGQMFLMSLTHIGSLNYIQGNVHGTPISWQGSGTLISGYQSCVP